MTVDVYSFSVENGERFPIVTGSESCMVRFTRLLFVSFVASSI